MIRATPPWPEWGLNAPRRMRIFLQKQALGSIPLAFSIFVAARSPLSVRLPDFFGALILLAASLARPLPTRSSAFPH